MRSLGIYIHLPFCIKKCQYCDFLSFSDKGSFVAEYFQALTAELKRYTFLSKDYIIDTVFLGGGTPTSIDSTYIVAFLREIRKIFQMSENSEITIEMNPGTVTDRKLSDYVESGINRFSLGVQTFDDIMLRRIGRIHTSEQVFQTVKLFHSQEIENFNIDMMHSLPYQRFDDLCKDLEILVSLNPAHISYYSLIVEEGTEFHSLYHLKPDIFPDEEEDRKMYHHIVSFLNQHGYRQYEISNYSKFNWKCRHNLKYWSLDEYLGLGLSSSSFVEGIRWRNTFDWNEYLSISQIGKKCIATEFQILSNHEKMEDFCIFALRTTEGINKKRFHELFFQDMEEVYGEVMLELIEEKLAAQNEIFFHLTPYGLDLANFCEMKFLLSK